MSIFKRKRKVKTQQILLLNEALKKLVEFGIATTESGKYQYSKSFEQTVKDIISSPPGRLGQLKYGQEAGRKLTAQLFALAVTKPSRKDIENLLVAYVCLKIYIDKHKLKIGKSIIPDLAYAVWFLNDNEPTIEEIEEWTLT